MTIENWGKDGMPPIYIDVLDRRITYQSKTTDFRSETLHIRGHHVHLGKLIQGYTGAETVVKREMHNGKMKVVR